MNVLELFKETSENPANSAAALAVCDHYAGNQRFVDKALLYRKQLGAVFDITIDLEDGAALGEIAQAATWAKQQLLAIERDLNCKQPASIHEKADCQAIKARQNTASKNASHIGKFGVRLHAYDTSAFAQELSILLAQPLPALSFIMLPKAENAAQVQAASDAISALCKKNGIEQPPFLHVLIETHGALAQVQAIAAMAGVQSLSFGLMDFVSNHHGAIGDEAMRSPKQFTHPLVARAKLDIAAACHRFGKTPSHNVCTDVKNPSQAAADAHIARNEFGYTRMWSIHPAQIEPIVQAFRPTHHEIGKATGILVKAAHANWGPIEYEGTLHDLASFRYYYNVIKQAQCSGVMLPAELAEIFSTH